MQFRNAQHLCIVDGADADAKFRMVFVQGHQVKHGIKLKHSVRPNLWQ
jgi:hypothetical protein